MDPRFVPSFKHRLAVAIAGGALSLVALTVLRFGKHELSNSPPTSRLVQVNVRIVDGDSQLPISSFRYKIRVMRPEGPYGNHELDWKESTDASGCVVVAVQAPCQLAVEAEAPDYIRGYNEGHDDFTIPSGNLRPEVVLELQRGITCRGRVIDGQSGSPISNARVCPRIFAPPMFMEDEERAVTTDEDGAFVLRGVNRSFGVLVSHDEYLEGGEFGHAGETENESGANRPGESADQRVVLVKLARGEIFRGMIVDRGGQPISQVSISDGAGKEITSDSEGQFVLNSPRKWWGNNDAYYLKFKHAEYVPLTLHPGSAPPEPMRVELDELSKIRGRVRSENGDPITHFHVIAGPGENPPKFRCKKADVNDAQGEFVLSVEDPGRNWLGIRAAGFAPWEGWIDASTASNVEVKLTAGVTVTGQVRQQSSTSDKIKAKLVPQRKDGSRNVVSETPSRDLATESSDISADGSFQFHLVRPDRYRLHITGASITPLVRNTIVPDGGLEIPLLKPQGTGTITGRVYDEESGKPVPFARGSWQFAESNENNQAVNSFMTEAVTSFMADQEGMFRIDQAPIGKVHMKIPFQISACMIGAHVREAYVVEGQTTQVNFFQPNDRNSLTLEFIIGDGTPAALRRGAGISTEHTVLDTEDLSMGFFVAMEPLSGTAISLPESGWHSFEPAKSTKVVLRDVSPGRFLLTVGGWHNFNLPKWAMTSFEVEKRDGRASVRVQLPSGCIMGKIQTTDRNRHKVRIVAISHDGATIRQTSGGRDGEFCFRCLPRGQYTIFAHCENEGWAQLPTTNVNENVREIGQHELRPGATISGHLSIHDGAPIPDQIEARHDSGIIINADSFLNHDGEKYTFAGLWPGDWEIQLKRKEKVLYSTTRRIVATETVEVELSSR